MTRHCGMHRMLLLLLYCSFLGYKHKLWQGTLLLCMYVLAVILHAQDDVADGSG